MVSELRIIPIHNLDVFTGMAIDEALLELAIQKESEVPILRFSRFQEKSISIGFSQRNSSLIASLESGKIPWVRRPTGGGFVTHHKDLIISMILPIKIHDLDAEDKATIEKEIGSVLRAIEFIFKSPGVNRPLRAAEDHPHDNLSKTYYRTL